MALRPPLGRIVEVECNVFVVEQFRPVTKEEVAEAKAQAQEWLKLFEDDKDEDDGT
jgi:hypothetical protein